MAVLYGKSCLLSLRATVLVQMPPFLVDFAAQHRKVERRESYFPFDILHTTWSMTLTNTIKSHHVFIHQLIQSTTAKEPALS
jgi:hypothetical protein